MSTGAFAANGDFSITRTGNVCRAISISSAMNVHRTAAVCTVQQTSQGMNFPPSVRVAPDSGSHPLHRIVGFLVDDWLMGVLDDGPLVLVNVVAFLLLKVFSCFEIAAVPEIRGIGQDVDDGGTPPSVRGSDFSCFPQPNSKLLIELDSHCRSSS